MKVRNGFVSNSSSSSFIVSAKDSKDFNGEAKIIIPVNLKEHGEILKTKKQVEDYFCEQHGVDSIEEFITETKGESDWGTGYDSYTKAIKAIENGEVVCAGGFCDENGDLEYALCRYGINEMKGINKIFTEGGY